MVRLWRSFLMTSRRSLPWTYSIARYSAPADLADVEHLHDVGVHEAAGDLRLVQEQIDRQMPALEQLALDPLERDRLLEAADADLLGQEHLGHAAGGQPPDDLVLAEDRVVGADATQSRLRRPARRSHRSAPATGSPRAARSPWRSQAARSCWPSGAATSASADSSPASCRRTSGRPARRTAAASSRRRGYRCRCDVRPHSTQLYGTSTDATAMLRAIARLSPATVRNDSVTSTSVTAGTCAGQALDQPPPFLLPGCVEPFDLRRNRSRPRLRRRRGTAARGTSSRSCR